MTYGIRGFQPTSYVASLADYNNGTLHGEWFDLAEYSDYDDLQDAVNAMLARSPFGNSEWAKKHGQHAEEYIIHDYEGFPQGFVSVYSNIHNIWELWEQFEECVNDDNVEAFVAYRTYFDGDYRAFQDSYRGEYLSEVEFAKDLLDETGELDCIPEHLRYYFDCKAYARALFSYDFTMIDTHVFSAF